MLSVGSSSALIKPVLQWSPDGWRPMSPAARSVTLYIPTPSPLSSSILEASMLTAIARSVLVPTPVAAVVDETVPVVPAAPLRSSTSGAVASARNGFEELGVVASSTLPLASAVMAPQPQVQQPSIQRAILGYTAGLVERVAAPRKGARSVGNEVWAGVRDPRSVHVSQVPSRFNPNPAPGNRDCGPASVVMALRLLGTPIPGVTPTDAPQKVINRARKLTGNLDASASTTNHELARALRAAGVSSREIMDAASIKAAVLDGKPVILNGNPRHAGAYGWKFSSNQMQPYNGAHWIVVSGWDTSSRSFIINDPLSKVGAVKVTPAQLEAYRGGSLGIEVSRA